MSRRTPLAVTALAAVLVPAAALLPAAPAAAAAPERTGWWTALSAGELAAPQPTTAEGDLRVAGQGTEPTAYAAVLHRAAGATAATLELAVREGSALGTVEVAACPTADTAWEAGGNQSMATAPVYDCAAGSAFGSLSEDGRTLTFALDDRTQLQPGVWSLALVPLPEGVAPFSVELLAPGEESFAAAEPVAADPAPAGEPAPDDGAPPVADDPAPAAPAGGPDSGFVDAPATDAGTGSTDLAPLLAGGVDGAVVPDAAPQPEPAIADTIPGVQPPTTLVAAPLPAAPAGGSTGRQLLALLALAGGMAAVGYAAGQQRPGPRLLGGRARVVGAGAAVPVPAAAPAPAERPRGIGRFARERDAAPRGLR